MAVAATTLACVDTDTLVAIVATGLRMFARMVALGTDCARTTSVFAFPGIRDKCASFIRAKTIAMGMGTACEEVVFVTKVTLGVLVRPLDAPTIAATPTEFAPAKFVFVARDSVELRVSNGHVFLSAFMGRATMLH